MRDRGVGLSRENLNRIFEPFYITKRNGLGMGLSVSRSIIKPIEAPAVGPTKFFEAHGGQVWARNHPDGGVSFLFTVPIEGVGRSA